MLVDLGKAVLMIRFEDPLILLVIFPLLFLWWHFGRGASSVRPLRVGIILLMAMILASPFFRGSRSFRHIVMLVDRSLSCGGEAVPKAEELAELLRDHLTPEDRITRVVFGDHASALPDEGSFIESGNTEYEDGSDITAGLALARALLAGHEEGGRIFLISDGNHTGTDPLEQVPALLKAGIPVDYSPLQKKDHLDVAVTQIHLPERVRQGRPFRIDVTIQSPTPCDSVLSVRRGDEVMKRPITLEAGTQRISLTDHAGPPGIMRYTIRILTEGDGRPENNRALAVTRSIGPASVLLLNRGVEGDTKSRESNLVRALRTAGIHITLGDARRALTSVDLKGHSAVVLENMPLSDLSDRADAALANYVRNMGGGLLVTGGRNSFAEGGYYKSRLEEVLPLSMMSREEAQRPRVAMCLVLDRSGSMSMNVSPGVTKMDLANKAACEAIGILFPQDEVAVLAVDSESHRVVGLTSLEKERDAVFKKVLSIESMGGGIFVYEGLSHAVRELLDSDAPTRHIALFADASDSESPDGYEELIESWVNAGGTLSVIGLGTESDGDADLLKDIASRGGGSAFFTSDPKALPRLFCQDAIRIARKTFIRERTACSVSPEIRRIGKLDLDAFPHVDGYNLCYLKQAATPLITSSDEHEAPILAVWRSGLGRVAAVTCEADGPFTGELRDAPEYAPFFTSLVKWIEREREDPSLFASIVRNGRTGIVKLELDEEAVKTCHSAKAFILPPSEGAPYRVPLQWTGSRTLEGRFRLESDGIYHGEVVTDHGRRVSLPPVTLPYSPEYEPVIDGAGMKGLEDLARATGGRRISHVRDLLDTESGTTRKNTSAVPRLAALLLALLVCDIITRRHLWSHLVPAALRSIFGKTARGASETMIFAYRRMKKGRDGKPETKPVESDVETEDEPPLKTPGKEKNIFEQAKRRSRFD